MNHRRLPLACCMLAVLAAQAQDFDADAMLAAHNHWRATVNVPPLAYSAELAASAQRWANQLKQHQHCQMKHSAPDSEYGENLYWASARKWSDGTRELQPVTPQQVVESWAGERADYDPVHNRCATDKVCGHYTQLVWRSTTAVGCAVATCSDTLEQVWVCHYAPAGNWVGQRPY